MPTGFDYYPEIELIAYQRGARYLDPAGRVTWYLEFYTAGSRWPLLLTTGEVAAALHHSTVQLTPDLYNDPDTLARLVVTGLARAGLDAVRELADPDHRDRLASWGGGQRAAVCGTAATVLVAGSPHTPRLLPPPGRPADPDDGPGDGWPWDEHGDDGEVA